MLTAKAATLRHVFHFGKIAYDNPNQKANAATVELELRDTDKGPELSICGSIWDRPHTDHLCGGQCLDTMRPYLKGSRRFMRLYALWTRWHLNGMNAGCEHQRALGWTSYDEHPSEPCPTCGYQYGTAWKYEALPADVLAEIHALIAEASEP